MQQNATRFGSELFQPLTPLNYGISRAQTSTHIQPHTQTPHLRSTHAAPSNVPVHSYPHNYQQTTSTYSHKFFIFSYFIF